MKNLHLQDIYIYPIKSLGGISLQQSTVEEKGLQYDRRWMLTDKDGNFLSQRNYAQMALLQVAIQNDQLLVSHKKHLLETLTIPISRTTGRELKVTIWDDVCTALEVDPIASEWFSEALGMAAQLVFMPPGTRRPVDPDYAINNDAVSFADAYPVLVIGQSSLDDINSRLEHNIPMDRFRPNLVFSGGMPFCEDSFKAFRIGEVLFEGVKPCYRCVMTTINQQDGSKGQEPLRTLATYRTVKNKVMFGQNLLVLKPGVIKIGDEIQLL